MTAPRPVATAIGLLLVAAVLLGWTVQEARHQRRAWEEALIREASILAAALGPGLEAASNAARELDELVLWKLLDNARLTAALLETDAGATDELGQLLDQTGLDTIAVYDRFGQQTARVGESFLLPEAAELAALFAGGADELVLGSTRQHDVDHLAAAARLESGGAVLTRVEWSTAHAFARRLGVEHLIEEMVGTGRVRYLRYREEPGQLLVEKSWDGSVLPQIDPQRPLIQIGDQAIFDIELPLEVPAGGQAWLRVGLDGSIVESISRAAMARTLVTGSALAALALAGTAYAAVSHLRGREREEALHRIAESEAARHRSERLAVAGALAAGLAHEIRSPMNAIGLAAQRLVRKLPAGSDEERIAARIAKEVRRQESVLRSFLELASPVAEDRTVVSVNGLATEVVELLETEAEPQRVHLVPPTGSGAALADREALRRALINVVRNAIQASPREGAVSLHVSADKERVAIQVRDEGPGLDPELRDQLFDPFVTGRKTGTGLGLALVKRVIEEHDGNIELFDRPEGGVEARIDLPVAKGAPA